MYVCMYVYCQQEQQIDLVSLGLDLSGHLTIAQDGIDKLEETSAGFADLTHASIVSVHLVHQCRHLLHLQPTQHSHSSKVKTLSYKVLLKLKNHFLQLM